MWRVLVIVCAFGAAPAWGRDSVTDWTLTADRLGLGGANWRTLAIMHRAMHDAVNAALPTYVRWHPAEPDEPTVAQGLDRVVMAEAASAAAARRVLLLLHPDQAAEVERTYARAQGRTPDGPAEDAGAALGIAIADAAVRRRTGDGFEHVRPFPRDEAVGRWRPTPQEFRVGNTTDTVPFLFSRSDEVPAPPPPALDSAQFLTELAETRAIGGAASDRRTALETEAAIYWYFQSSQRGFLHLSVSVLDSRPSLGSLAESARFMSQLASALADSAVLIWWEKERFLFWRPVTAIRAGGPGFEADPYWAPLIDTPPHPEYPSGHASDCFVGAMMLQRTFPELQGAVAYVAQPGRPVEADAMGMGQHSLTADSGLRAKRTYPSLPAMAEDCSNSRIWAGAHFRAADEEARRVATMITGRALAAVPLLPRP